MSSKVKSFASLLFSCGLIACSSSPDARERLPPGCCAQSGERLCALRFPPKEGAPCLCAEAELELLEKTVIALEQERAELNARFNSARHLAAHPPAGSTPAQIEKNQADAEQLGVLLRQMDKEGDAIFAQLRSIRESQMAAHPEQVGRTCW